MAQVLLDQKSNQLRLKRGFYEVAKKLLSSDINDCNSTANKLKRPTKSRQKQKKLNNVSKLNDQELIGFNSEDSEICDDPYLSQAVNTSEVSNKKAKGFSCLICEHVASSSQRLKEHQSRHTGVKPLECKICGKKFAWRYSFQSHMAAHNENNPNKCTVCGKRYCNKSSMNNHILRVHGNPKKDFKCNKCSKEFITKPELDRHCYTHTKFKPFVCEYCGNAYRFKAALLVHYRVHSGEKPYKCNYCDEAFIHLSSAIGHRRRHTGEKPFQCNTCGKLFRMKRALTSHMSVHSEIKHFKCDKCEKSFKSRSGYRVHLDFHLGIKRHKCKFCEKSFRAWCNMHKHMKRHLAEKSYKCDLCNQSFAEELELKIHVETFCEANEKSDKLSENQDTFVNNYTQMIVTNDLNCSGHIDTSNAFSESHPTDEIIQTHIDVPCNQPVNYDCSTTDKTVDKCQLLQDSYLSQFLYPQHSTLQYSCQSVPMFNMLSNDMGTLNRSVCLSNMSSTNFNCTASNQNYGNFPYNLQSSDDLFKCKLCRSLFHSITALRSHLLEYHRIEEENIDGLIP